MFLHADLSDRLVKFRQIFICGSFVFRIFGPPGVELCFGAGQFAFLCGEFGFSALKLFFRLLDLLLAIFHFFEKFFPGIVDRLLLGRDLRFDLFIRNAFDPLEHRIDHIKVGIGVCIQLPGTFDRYIHFGIIIGFKIGFRNEDKGIDRAGTDRGSAFFVRKVARPVARSHHFVLVVFQGIA